MVEVEDADETAKKMGFASGVDLLGEIMMLFDVMVVAVDLEDGWYSTFVEVRNDDEMLGVNPDC